MKGQGLIWSQIRQISKKSGKLWSGQIANGIWPAPLVLFRIYQKTWLCIWWDQEVIDCKVIHRATPFNSSKVTSITYHNHGHGEVRPELEICPELRSIVRIFINPPPVNKLWFWLIRWIWGRVHPKMLLKVLLNLLWPFLVWNILFLSCKWRMKRVIFITQITKFHIMSSCNQNISVETKGKYKQQ